MKALHVQWSEDAGRTWTEPAVVGGWYEKLVGIRHPSAMVDREGKIWAAAAGPKAIHIWAFEDLDEWGKRKYSPPDYMPAKQPTSSTARLAYLRQLPDGLYALAYVDTRWIMMQSTSRDGIHWGKPSPVSPFAGAGCVMAARDGGLWITYNARGGVVLRRRKTRPTARVGKGDA